MNKVYGYFDCWLKQLMARNEIKGWEELAERLSITRMTLYNWRKNPERLSRFHIAGIMGILCDEDHELGDLCDMFLIDKNAKV